MSWNKNVQPVESVTWPILKPNNPKGRPLDPRSRELMEAANQALEAEGRRRQHMAADEKTAEDGAVASQFAYSAE